MINFRRLLALVIIILTILTSCDKVNESNKDDIISSLRSEIEMSELAFEGLSDEIERLKFALKECESKPVARQTFFIYWKGVSYEIDEKDWNEYKSKDEYKNAIASMKEIISAEDYTMGDKLQDIASWEDLLDARAIQESSISMKTVMMHQMKDILVNGEPSF